MTRPLDAIDDVVLRGHLLRAAAEGPLVLWGLTGRQPDVAERRDA